MPQDVRLWRVSEGGSPSELLRSRLQAEETLEDWLEQDISILSEDLLVIGRQVETDFGGAIDLVCIDANGDLAIVELKRGKTPREIMAQALDYASWVAGLSNEAVTRIANDYLGPNGPLDRAFQEKFDTELPEVLNEGHQMLIVGSEIDQSSERIIGYLSDTYGVGINAATFNYFEDSAGGRFVARVFLVEPEQVEYSRRTRGGSKRKPNLTYDEIEQKLSEKGLADVYERAFDGLVELFDSKKTTRSTVAFRAKMGDSRKVILSLCPEESQSDKGLCFDFYVERLRHYVGASEEQIFSLFPQGLRRFVPWAGSPQKAQGYLSSEAEVDRLMSGLRQLQDEGTLTA